MDLLESLNWRYATKKYDTEKKVSEDDINKLKEAIRLAPTSYGLQLFKVLDIRSADLKEKLVGASWGQLQSKEASHFFVFCVPTELRGEHIDEFIRLRAESQGVDPAGMAGYGEFIKGKKLDLSAEENREWLAKQAYIALGFLHAAAAEMKIDTTPMEGFEARQVSEILDLGSKGLTPVVLAAIGHRSAEDQAQHAPKFRRTLSDLFEEV